MESIFNRLRNAREAKGLSLEDIASSTNINVSFLHSLEEGKTDILPQVYVRAFVREYASMVDLDPDEIITAYEAETQTASENEAETSGAPVSPQKPDRADGPPSFPVPKPKIIAAAAAVLIIAGVLYLNLSRPSPDESNQAPPPESFVPETTTGPQTTVQPAASADSDSLLLRARTTDTVWVLVVIDGVDSLEYIFRPNVTATWTAGKMFSVSVGRPDAVEFTLNGEPMGALGTRRRIIRDSLITHQTFALLKER